VQAALEIAQDVHLVTVEFFKREELGEVKLSILKKETTALALSAEMVMLIKPPNNPVRETTAGSPATHYQVGKHSSLKEKNTL
jgi:hypothetical protein